MCSDARREGCSVVTARAPATRDCPRWLIVGLAALCVGCAGTADPADPTASSRSARPAACGFDAVAVAKTFVAAIQAGDQPTIERCENPALKLSADMVQGLESGVYLLDAATVTDRVIPPHANQNGFRRLESFTELTQ